MRILLLLAIPLLVLSLLACNAANVLAQSRCSDVSLASPDRSALPAELCMPPGQGPFAAVVDLRARSCDGPQGIPPGWEQSALPSWGYAVLTIDSLAARGLAPKKCSDWAVLTSRQVISDAYAGLDYLARDGRVDPKRIALLGFRAGIGTAALLADTAEASEVFASNGSPRFRAVFAISPYCNLSFSGAAPRLCAPVRIFTGEKDDFEPAERCIELAKSLQASGANVDVTVYPDAVAGFDLTPPDTNYPMRDPTALHPGGVTVSTHPQYSPWANNFANCTIRLESIFDPLNPSDFRACARRGAHFQGNAEIAVRLQSDLKAALDEFVGKH
jgi:dienelactone hydrolase